MMRSRLIAEMRRFIDAHGFYEVETPTLLHVAGGAAARPFVTHCNALDKAMQLRIATELNLKRLIVAGLERVYEIGRIFRNEGIDTTHNPEFTMLELYAAYWDVYDMMEFNEALIAHLVSVATDGGTDLPHGDATISFQRPFARIEYLDAMARYSGGKYTRERLLDPRGRAGDPARAWLARLADARARARQDLRARRRAASARADLRHGLSGRDLAAREARADDPEIVDRYELFCANMEISNAFTELNDPDDQRARFEAQVAERARRRRRDSRTGLGFRARARIRHAADRRHRHRRRPARHAADQSALDPRRAALSAAAPARLTTARRVAILAIVFAATALAPLSPADRDRLLLSRPAQDRPYAPVAAAAAARLARGARRRCRR